MRRTLITSLVCLGLLVAPALAKRPRVAPPPRKAPVVLVVYEPRDRTPLVVAALPPPPLLETVTERPRPDAVWISGHWRWNGVRFRWSPGLWSAPRPGYVWAPSQWLRLSDGRWQWVPGRWLQVLVVPRT